MSVYKEAKRVAYAGRKVEVKTATKSKMNLRWGGYSRRRVYGERASTISSIRGIAVKRRLGIATLYKPHNSIGFRQPSWVIAPREQYLFYP